MAESSPNAEAAALVDELATTRPLNKDLRELAKKHAKQHELAAYLWSKRGFHARMLSLLILDMKRVDVAHIERLISDLETVTDPKEQSQLLDWMIANVIMKKPPLKAGTTEWRADKSLLKQRVFWGVHARSVKAENRELNEELLGYIENGLADAPEKVKWNMNWCAAQIGIADEKLRGRCIALGEKLRLYEDYPTPKGCTSPYLPSWIGAVVAKKGG